MMIKTAPGSTIAPIQTMEPSQSPLLRLPAEIRNQICEYVLCNKKIHVSMRPVLENEPGGCLLVNGAIWLTEMYKPMYCVCLAGDHWSAAYKPNKVAVTEKQQGGVSYARASHVHKGCEDVLKDLRWQDFRTGMPKQACECVTKPCMHFFSHRNEMIRRYGPLPEGLKLAHADTKLDLALLRTCKMLYNDTALLPYIGNTFSFSTPTELSTFQDKVLTQQQKEALANAEVYIGTTSRPTLRPAFRKT